MAGAVAAGCAVGGGVLGTGLVSGAGPAAALRDADPLALALTVERLQAAFYARAIDGGALTGDLLEFARTASGHEAEHARLLQPIAGRMPAEPAYDFGAAVTDADAFGALSAELEDLAVGAYNGLIPALSPRGLAVAAEIVTVDARHAAWVRAIMGEDPAEGATDDALSPAQVVGRISRLGVLVEVTP